MRRKVGPLIGQSQLLPAAHSSQQVQLLAAQNAAVKTVTDSKTKTKQKRPNKATKGKTEKTTTTTTCSWTNSSTNSKEKSLDLCIVRHQIRMPDNIHEIR